MGIPLKRIHRLCQAAAKARDEDAGEDSQASADDEAETDAEGSWLDQRTHRLMHAA